MVWRLSKTNYLRCWRKIYEQFKVKPVMETNKWSTTLSFRKSDGWGLLSGIAMIFPSPSPTQFLSPLALLAVTYRSPGLVLKSMLPESPPELCFRRPSYLSLFITCNQQPVASKLQITVRNDSMLTEIRVESAGRASLVSGCKTAQSCGEHCKAEILNTTC